MFPFLVPISMTFCIYTFRRGGQARNSMITGTYLQCVILWSFTMFVLRVRVISTLPLVKELGLEV